MKDITVRNGFDKLDIKDQNLITKMSINFYNEHKVLGKFFEDENGKMSFEGDVNESAKIFIEYSLKSFNARIEQIKRESQPKDLWAECVDMLGKYLQIHVGHWGYELINHEGEEVDKWFFKTLPELHAKLTKLTKG